jgi:hypothetical protein
MPTSPYTYLPLADSDGSRQIATDRRVKDLQVLRDKYVATGRAENMKQLLGGDCAEVSRAPAEQGRIPHEKILKELEVHQDFYLLHATGNPEHFFHCADNYNAIARNNIFDGMKVYISMHLTAPSLIQLGSNFFREFTEGMIRERRPFATKWWHVHIYDAMLLYIHDLEAAAKVLTPLFEKYVETGLLWSTEHFGQGQLGLIDPTYVGWVHEPLISPMPKHKTDTSRELGSHSGRMGALGDYLDAHGITVESYMNAALHAGIDPAQPYFMDRDYYPGGRLLNGKESSPSLTKYLER